MSKLHVQIQNCLEEKYAMPAINVQTIDHISILSEYSEAHNFPIIAQFSARFIAHFDHLVGLNAIVERYKQSTSLYFHLDHCMNFDIIKKCIDSKFDAVMFDGSSLHLSENIKLSKQIKKLAKNKGVLLEGEIGQISGVEDGLGTENGDYADLNDAITYYRSTKVDLFAIAIGNAHGFYKSTGDIKVELLESFNNKLPNMAPLVLHGGTGIPFKMVQRAIKCGVVKVNYSTDFKKINQDSMNKEVQNELFNSIRFYETLKCNMFKKLDLLRDNLKST